MEAHKPEILSRILPAHVKKPEIAAAVFAAIGRR
jgi:hypothetical protein